MSTDTALIEKREELKHRLAAGEYKTLVDVFLVWIDRVIRKITRQTKPLPIWLITVVLSFVSILIGFAAIYIGGYKATIGKFVESMGLGYELGAPWVISNYVFFIVSAVVINQYIDSIFVFWRDHMLAATESLVSLDRFQNWLERTSNRRLHLLVTVIAGTLGALYVTALVSIQLGILFDYGLTFISIIPSMFSFSLLYQFMMVILLSARLRRYDLKLFAPDPSSTELVSSLSGELNIFVYLVALYAAVSTLSGALTGFLPSAGIVLVLLLWLPIIIMFILNQTGLSSIIRRAKWKSLNEIQAKVEKLQSVGNFENKGTMEAINRLMDYHNRVKSTRNSAIDLGTTLNFINSLLLPLLAFILGNLDLVLNLFARKP